MPFDATLTVRSALERLGIQRRGDLAALLRE